MAMAPGSPGPHGSPTGGGHFSLWKPDVGWLRESLKLSAIRPEMGAGMFSWGGIGVQMADEMVLGGRLLGAKAVSGPVAHAAAPLMFGHMNLGGAGAVKQSIRSMQAAGKTTAQMRRIMHPKRGLVGRFLDKGLNMMVPEKILVTNRAVAAGIQAEILAGRSVATVGGKEVVRRGLSSAVSKFGAFRVGAYAVSRLGSAIGWGLLAYDAARLTRWAGQATSSYANNLRNISSQSETTSQMTTGEVIMTERRRSLLAISQSRMNARSAFGHEARRAHLR